MASKRLNTRVWSRDRLPAALVACCFAGGLALAGGGADHERDKTATTVAPDSTPAPEAPDRPQNLLLITLDTTRADYLSCHGFPLLTSPNIDALAAGGVRFARASAITPLTGPSHATMLTGLSPRDHGSIRNGVPLTEGVPTLADFLSASGYRTAAFVSGWTLKHPLAGLQQGFSLYDDDLTDRYHLVNNQRPGNETTDRALAWLQEGEAPFFLWVHMFDPHDPYHNHKLKLAPNPKGTGPVPVEKNRLNYAQEIAFADAQVGRLMEALQRMDLLDSTLVVFTSDHGEAFGEHGEKGHGRHLYETTQHVPLIVSHRTLPRGSVSDLPVSTLDVLPTILEVLQRPAIPGMEGIPLGSAIHDPLPHMRREIQMETFHGARKKFWRWFAPALTGEPIQVAIRRDNWKAIMNPHSEEVQLFDLAADPAEGIDLAEAQSYRTRHFRPLLDQLASKEWNGTPEQAKLTKEDRRRLESLGYTN